MHTVHIHWSEPIYIPRFIVRSQYTKTSVTHRTYISRHTHTAAQHRFMSCDSFTPKYTSVWLRQTHISSVILATEQTLLACSWLGVSFYIIERRRAHICSFRPCSAPSLSVSVSNSIDKNFLFLSFLFFFYNVAAAVFIVYYLGVF